MTVEFPPPLSAFRALNALPDEPSKEEQDAKNAMLKFSSRLSSSPGLEPAEKAVLRTLASAIYEGDLKALQEAVLGFAANPNRLQNVSGLLSAQMQCPGVRILDAPIARWRFADEDQAQEVAVFSIHLTRARRILALATDQRFGVRVLGPGKEDDRNIGNELNEDPRILLKQIGRVATLASGQTPPPFSGA